MECLELEREDPRGLDEKPESRRDVVVFEACDKLCVLEE
jgi:hypothetical protein